MKNFFENNADTIAENTPVGNAPELAAEFATFGGEYGGSEGRITTGYKPAAPKLEGGV